MKWFHTTYVFRSKSTVRGTDSQALEGVSFKFIVTKSARSFLSVNSTNSFVTSVKQ